MRSTILLTGLAALPFIAADLVPAIERREPTTALETRDLTHTLQTMHRMGKRQFCPLDYSFCIADDGATVCQAPDEYCCQTITTLGDVAFTCPADHPYCCGPDASTGILLCGSDSTCGEGGFASAPPVQSPTQATGQEPTATATAKANGGGGASASGNSGGQQTGGGQKTTATATGGSSNGGGAKTTGGSGASTATPSTGGVEKLVGSSVQGGFVAAIAAAVVAIV